jgi:hypothetical protein
MGWPVNLKLRAWSEHILIVRAVRTVLSLSSSLYSTGKDHSLWDVRGGSIGRIERTPLYRVRSATN